MPGPTFGASKVTIQELERVLKGSVADILYLQAADVVVRTNLGQLEQGYWAVEVSLRQLPKLYHRNYIPLEELESSINPGQDVSVLGGGIGKAMIAHMIIQLQRSTDLEKEAVALVSLWDNWHRGGAPDLEQHIDRFRELTRNE